MLNLKNLFFSLLCLTALTNQSLISGDGSAFGKPTELSESTELSEDELLAKAMNIIKKDDWHKEHMRGITGINDYYNEAIKCFNGRCTTGISKLEKDLNNLQGQFIDTITERINMILANDNNSQMIKNQLSQLLNKLIVQIICTSALTQTYINAIKRNNFDKQAISSLTGQIVIEASHATAQLNRGNIADPNLKSFFEDLQAKLFGIAEQVKSVYPVQLGKRSYRGSPRGPRTTISSSPRSPQRCAADVRGRVVRPLATGSGVVVPTIQLTPEATPTASRQRSASRSRSLQISALRGSDASATRTGVARALF